MKWRHCRPVGRRAAAAGAAVEPVALLLVVLLAAFAARRLAQVLRRPGRLRGAARHQSHRRLRPITEPGAPVRLADGSPCPRRPFLESAVFIGPHFWRTRTCFYRVLLGFAGFLLCLTGSRGIERELK